MATPLSRLASVCLLWLAPAAFAQETLSPPARVEPKGAVFTVGGSADLGSIGDSMATALASGGIPYQVHSFRWSSGAILFRDLRSTTLHRSKGRELAGMILGYRESHPDEKVHVVCFSAGAAIVLNAAEILPRGCVDRVVFLAPACSTHHDVRQVLTCSREGVDVFYSTTDLVCQTLSVVGNTDGWRYAAAGAAGFMPVEEGSPDITLYHGLRQHQDNFGGHFSCVKAEFLRKNIVPLLGAPLVSEGQPEFPARSATTVPAQPVALPYPDRIRGGLTPIGPASRIK